VALKNQFGAGYKAGRFASAGMRAQAGCRRV